MVALGKPILDTNNKVSFCQALWGKTTHSRIRHPEYCNELFIYHNIAESKDPLLANIVQITLGMEQPRHMNVIDFMDGHRSFDSTGMRISEVG
jgi:hypothetical protein